MGRSRRKVVATVKLELEAGRATPAPPVGRDLGPHGVNLAEFVRRYNDATSGQEGMVAPVVVTIYEDRSFDFVKKTPPTAFLLRRAAGTELPDLNAGSVEASMRVVEGTARSMGVRVAD